MMITSVSVFIFFAGIQVITSQGVPYQQRGFNPAEDTHPCSRPPAGTNAFQCCPLPPMHKEDDFKHCDFGRTTDIHGCSQKLCLLRNKGILNSNDTINIEKLETFLENWSKDEAHIKDAIQISKKLCFDNTDIKKPPAYVIKTDPVCEADKLYHCMTASIIWNCKLKEEIPGCKKLKEHVETCKPYFF